MARKVIVHIGRNKTGSTALQDTLAVNRDVLTRQGIDYSGVDMVDGYAAIYGAPHGKRPSTSHGYLALHLNSIQRQVLEAEEQAQNAAASEDLRNSLVASSNTFLISTEGLQNIRPDILRAWLPPIETNIVVYIREQAEYLMSCYSQAVKARNVSDDFATFISKYNADYRPFLAAWTKIFGADRVIVRVYDKSRLANGDIVDDFAQLIGVDPAQLARAPLNPNPSIGGALLEAKRRINVLGVPEQRLRKATYAALLKIARKRPEYSAHAIAKPDHIAKMRNQYAAANQEVAQTYLDGEPLFAPSPARSPEQSYSEQDVHRAIAEIAEAVQKTDAEVAKKILTIARKKTWREKLLAKSSAIGPQD